jgi:hypothetical protein
MIIMPRLLYSQSTQAIKPYPRNDNAPIVGLSPDYLVLDQITAEPPEYDEETQTVTPSWVIDVDNLEYRQEWVVSDKPEPEPLPNWDGFNAYMLTDSMFKTYRDTVRAIDGDLNAALFNAYALIERNGVAAFTLVWVQWTQLSGITTEGRETIATVAESFNLPVEFVGVIRG